MFICVCAVSSKISVKCVIKQHYSLPARLESYREYYFPNSITQLFCTGTSVHLKNAEMC